MNFESNATERLKELPDTLEKTYKEIFDTKICAEKGNSPLLAHKAMMWIMCSSRPLSPSQLVTGAVVGLQLATGSPRVKDVDLEMILKICHNLVVLDRQLSVVRFAHLSVQEYLEKRHWDTVATNTMAAEVCIYILNDPGVWKIEAYGEGFEGGYDEGYDEQYDEEDDEESDEEGDEEGGEEGSERDWTDEEDVRSDISEFKINALLQYSVYHWPDHARNCDGCRRSDKLPMLLRTFLGSFNKAGPAYMNWYEEASDPTSFGCLVSDPPHPMLAAASYGLGEVLEDWWEKVNVDLASISNESVLYTASRLGHEWIVKKLLERGADASFQGGFYGNPLQSTATAGSEPITRLLIEHGADINTNCGHFGDALQAAVWYGFELVARQLLEHGAEVNTQHGFWGSPLQAAADAGHEKLLRMLLDYGANVNMLGGRHGSPLHAAASAGNNKLVRMLLKEGADINATCNSENNETVLQSAAFSGKEETVRLLLSEMKRHKLQIASTAGSSAACSAVLANSLDTVRAIVKAGGEINIPSATTSKTALQHALELRSRPIINYLISQVSDLQLLRLSLRDVRPEDIDWAHDESWFCDLEAVLESNIVQKSRCLTPRDILQARLILHKGIGLPILITDKILNLGEYWVRTTVSRREQLWVRDGSPDLAYIELPICSRLKSPVRKIVFHIRSHDQGISKPVFHL